MRKLQGWIALIAAIFWCLLMLPAFIYFPLSELYFTFIHLKGSSLLHYAFTLFSAIMAIGFAIFVTKFGINLLMSSLRIIMGVSDERLTISKRVARRKQ